ncbi:MAG: hypothetical protein VYC39_00600 [Myxococcota bacterium]|nr:hypothetical protein [Myxococcota bacterium]
MSLTKRFINAAKAELKSVVRSLIAESQSANFEIPRTDREKKLDEKVSSPLQVRFENLPSDVCRAYEVVNLPIGTSFDEIRAAYRRQKKMTSKHPNAHSKLSQNDVEKAYETLALHFKKSLRSENAL